MIFEGVYTALVTPFNDKNGIDLEGLGKLIEHNIASGVHGITVLGSTGESPTIRPKERSSIIHFSIEQTKGRVPVMVGCTENDTNNVIELAQEAQRLGASSLLIATPYYNRPTQEGIYRHFQAISLSVSLPICIYNVPSRTGQNIEHKTIERLSILKNIVGIKEASGNIAQITDTLELFFNSERRFAVLSGDDSLFFDVIALGGQGIVSVLSNLLPQQISLLYHAVTQGEIALARNLLYALRPLIKALSIETNPIPIKYLLYKAGLIETHHLRLPLCGPSEESMTQLDSIYELTKYIIQEELSIKESS